MSVGSPVSINQHTELLPLFGVDIFDANTATEHISRISEALEAPSMNGAQLLKLGDHASALLEQLPNPPTGVGIGFHVIGLVRTLPRAATALTKPGPKKTVEVGKAVFPFFAALGEPVTDIPGLEHGKTVRRILVVSREGRRTVLHGPGFWSACNSTVDQSLEGH